MTPLIKAVCSKNLEIVKTLINNGHDINEKDYIGNTLLHLNVSLDIAKFLIEEKGIDINTQNNNGDTPLHINTNLDVVKYFVENGANINIRNKLGWTPLLWNLLIYKDTKLDIAKYLIENGADINISSLYNGILLLDPVLEVTQNFNLYNFCINNGFKTNIKIISNSWWSIIIEKLKSMLYLN